MGLTPVTLRSEDGVDLPRGICQNIDSDLIIEADGKPLGDDRIAVQIVESLNEELFSSANMWSLRSWHIKHLFFHDDVSLYDHDQTHIYKVATKSLNTRVFAKEFDHMKALVTGLILLSVPRKSFSPQWNPSRQSRQKYVVIGTLCSHFLVGL